MMLPYPWHKALWDKVARVEALPHGILIHGRQGIGKLHFARCLAALLLCSRQDKFRGACGSCSGCHFMMQGVHPDYVEICPDEEEDGKKMSRLIKVEQIRDLGEMLSLTDHQNGCRVVLIHPAESLNI
ncbi:MAG: DNA polymerase III subunit delta', partial [Pseudomonadota bacterium]|nr:DNA polymerase III subunit delta' [Pseudomonadota bacterium]